MIVRFPSKMLGPWPTIPRHKKILMTSRGFLVETDFVSHYWYLHTMQSYTAPTFNGSCEFSKYVWTYSLVVLVSFSFLYKCAIPWPWNFENIFYACVSFASSYFYANELGRTGLSLCCSSANSWPQNSGRSGTAGTVIISASISSFTFVFR